MSSKCMDLVKANVIIYDTKEAPHKHLRIIISCSHYITCPRRQAHNRLPRMCNHGNKRSPPICNSNPWFNVLVNFPSPSRARSILSPVPHVYTFHHPSHYIGVSCLISHLLDASQHKCNPNVALYIRSRRSKQAKEIRTNHFAQAQRRNPA
jgi:hypothetical protein